MFYVAALKNGMEKYIEFLFDVWRLMCHPPFSFVSQHGEQWKEDACTLCVCDQGEVRCHKQACPPLKCEKVFESMWLILLSLILDHFRKAFLSLLCSLIDSKALENVECYMKT